MTEKNIFEKHRITFDEREKALNAFRSDTFHSKL